MVAKPKPKRADDRQSEDKKGKAKQRTPRVRAERPVKKMEEGAGVRGMLHRIALI